MEVCWTWENEEQQMNNKMYKVSTARKRKRGRPRRRWADDLAKYKSNLHALTAHREEWKKLTEGYIQQQWIDGD